MSQRIRYEKTDKPHILQSVRTFTSIKTGSIYRVFLNTEEKSYQIRNVETNRNYTKYKASRMFVVKRQVKRHLAELGVEFDMEIRKERL